jgi:hypothetical protein
LGSARRAAIASNRAERRHRIGSGRAHRFFSALVVTITVAPQAFADCRANGWLSNSCAERYDTSLELI